MTIRIEVLEGGQIEVLRPRPGAKSDRYETPDKEMAIIMLRHWLNEDIEQAEKERFVSKQTKEVQKAFKQLSERSPYRDTSDRQKAEGSSGNGKPAH